MGWRRRRQEQERAGLVRHPRCVATYKVSFPSREAAEAKIREIGVDGWIAYQCRWCPGFHVSSRGTGGHRRSERTIST